MRRRMTALLAIAVVAIAISACGDDGGGGEETEGETLVVGVDLPFQGAAKDASDQTWNAMQLFLEQAGGKAGKYKVELKKYDDSTAAKGGWDDATCAKNAQDHVANENQVAVMGTYNSGCAKIIAPVLNQDPSGPMLMVSHANTNVGLTKKWDPGEPEKFFPSGKRSYARVITTDEYQGAAAAQFSAKDLQVKKCFVLNDNQTYGQGVARSFVEEAKKQGITITGEQAWDAKQPNYTALFQSIKATGSDCVYIAGIFDLNGGQLVKDKVAVLGDNNAVKLIVPDGFTGYPDFTKLPEAEGTYLTFAGLATEALRAQGGKAGAFLDAYKAKYGSDPSTSYALYGVQALQVILAAIEKSDGSRKAVRDAVFEGAGINFSAADAMLGKALKIDPATGDVDVKDISVLKMTSGVEKFSKAWPIG